MYEGLNMGTFWVVTYPEQSGPTSNEIALIPVPVHTYIIKKVNV